MKKVAQEKLAQKKIKESSHFKLDFNRRTKLAFTRQTHFLSKTIANTDKKFFQTKKAIHKE